MRKFNLIDFDADIFRFFFSLFYNNRLNVHIPTQTQTHSIKL